MRLPEGVLSEGILWIGLAQDFVLSSPVANSETGEFSFLRNVSYYFIVHPRKEEY